MTSLVLKNRRYSKTARTLPRRWLEAAASSASLGEALLVGRGRRGPLKVLVTQRQESDHQLMQRQFLRYYPCRVKR